MCPRNVCQASVSKQSSRNQVAYVELPDGAETIGPSVKRHAIEVAVRVKGESAHRIGTVRSVERGERADGATAVDDLPERVADDSVEVSLRVQDQAVRNIQSIDPTEDELLAVSIIAIGEPAVLQYVRLMGSPLKPAS